MAVNKSNKSEKQSDHNPKFKRTSIGCGNNSRPNSKVAKRSWKKYRGQGR